MSRALGFASCDITHETGSTIFYGHWVLHLVISRTRQAVRFVRGIAFCVLRYRTRDRGYNVLQALGSASCDITHETRGTICYGHWVLLLVISHTCDLIRSLGSASCEITHTRQRERFVTGIGFCVLRYHTRDRGYDLLRALGSVSCNITDKTGVLFVTGIGSASCDITHETGGTICYGHWVLPLVISHTRQRVRFITGIGFCIL